MHAYDRTFRRARGNEISMIFQEPITSFNPVLTIGTQIAEVIILHRACSASEVLYEARRLIKRVKIPDPACGLARYRHGMSGGMRPARDDCLGAGLRAAPANRR